MKQQVSIEKARAKLGDIIDRTRYTSDDPVVITRHGEPAAMITRVVAPRDREYIARAARMTDPAYPLPPEEARNVIAGLLDILTVYLSAPRSDGQEHDAGSKP